MGVNAGWTDLTCEQQRHVAQLALKPTAERDKPPGLQAALALLGLERGNQTFTATKTACVNSLYSQWMCKYRKSYTSCKSSLMLMQFKCKEDVSPACIWSCCREKRWQQLLTDAICSFPSPLIWATTLWKPCHPDHISPDWLDACDLTNIHGAKNTHLSEHLCRKEEGFQRDFFMSGRILYLDEEVMADLTLMTRFLCVFSVWNQNSFDLQMSFVWID